MAIDSLFEPFTLGSLRLGGRIALASLARWACPDGDPAPLADYYRSRVEGGVALVMTEGAAIGRPAAYNDPRNARFFGAALESWPSVVETVHQAGGAIIPQLWHAGAVGKKASDWRQDGEPESPSGSAGPGLPRGAAMTDAAVDAVLAAYAKAGADALALGFDGVEIHAGHGYLLDQFFWDQTNMRADHWGGATLAERSRFPLEVVRAVRAAAPGLPLLIRISHWKSADVEARLVETSAELEAWLTPFVDAGVDLFDVSTLRYETPLFARSPLSFAGWVKQVTGCPVMACGGVGMDGDFMRTFAGQTGHPTPVDDVARRIETGEFDLVAVGRALVADPAWPTHLRAGGPLTPCAPAAFAPVLS